MKTALAVSSVDGRDHPLQHAGATTTGRSRDGAPRQTSAAAAPARKRHEHQPHGQELEAVHQEQHEQERRTGRRATRDVDEPATALTAGS